jgi:hypothetical protein
VLTVADEILASLAFILFVVKLLMFAVDTDMAKLLIEPVPAAPRLLMYCTDNVLMFPDNDAVLKVDKVEIYAVLIPACRVEKLVVPTNPAPTVVALNVLIFAEVM